MIAGSEFGLVRAVPGNSLKRAEKGISGLLEFGLDPWLVLTPC